MFNGLPAHRILTLYFFTVPFLYSQLGTKVAMISFVTIGSLYKKTICCVVETIHVSAIYEFILLFALKVFSTSADNRVTEVAMDSFVALGSS